MKSRLSRAPQVRSGLTGSHRVVDCADGLLERCRRIDAVRVEDVDMVEAETGRAIRRGWRAGRPGRRAAPRCASNGRLSPKLYQRPWEIAAAVRSHPPEGDVTDQQVSEHEGNHSDADGGLDLPTRRLRAHRSGRAATRGHLASTRRLGPPSAGRHTAATRFQEGQCCGSGAGVQAGHAGAPIGSPPVNWAAILGPRRRLLSYTVALSHDSMARAARSHRRRWRSRILSSETLCPPASTRCRTRSTDRSSGINKTRTTIGPMTRSSSAHPGRPVAICYGSLPAIGNRTGLGSDGDGRGRRPHRSNRLGRHRAVAVGVGGCLAARGGRPAALAVHVANLRHVHRRAL